MSECFDPHHKTNSAHELIEVYTLDGKPTGTAQPRSKIHSEGIWHKTVHTWILETSSKRLLIQRRSPHKLNHPNLWDVSSAGHMSFDQQTPEAAIREVEEELGLTITREELGSPIDTLRVQLVLNEGTYLDNEFIDVFLVKREHVDLSSLKLQAEEVCDAQLIHYAVLEHCYKMKHPDFVILQNSDEFMERFFKHLRQEIVEESDDLNLEKHWPSFIRKI
nr:unnamed protein product [Naegleria fowleri]